MSIAAVILRNAHICIEKMNTVNILIIIINFSTLFSLCYIFFLLCVVSFLYINQSINYFVPLFVTLETLKVNKSLHYGGFSCWGCLFLLHVELDAKMQDIFLLVDIDQCFTYLLTSSLCNYTIIIPTENNFVAHFVMCS